MVGALLGLPVGAEEGAGLLVGDELPGSDGSGDAEGPADGFMEGLKLGEADGPSLGMALGLAEGVSDGSELGLAEGKVLGGMTHSARR